MVARVVNDAGINGVMDWGVKRDRFGHREFFVKHLVECTTKAEGPYAAMLATGLPDIGGEWNFSTSEVDIWAFCTPERNVSVHQQKQGEVNYWFDVESIYSTVPRSRCQDFGIEDPLLEPPTPNGGFTKFTEEKAFNRFGNLVKNSAHEPMQGPKTEFDAGRPSLSWDQNVGSLQYDLLLDMIDHVNDAPIWGFDTRCVKLSDIKWSRKVYGLCNFFYTRHFEFDVNKNTFDRRLLDEGTKILRGHWETTAVGTATAEWVLDKINGEDPDYTNPAHFIHFKDLNGENARCILNGYGLPAYTLVEEAGTGTDTQTTSVGYIDFEYYPEANFLLLGLPASF